MLWKQQMDDHVNTETSAPAKFKLQQTYTKSNGSSARSIINMGCYDNSTCQCRNKSQHRKKEWKKKRKVIIFGTCEESCWQSTSCYHRNHIRSHGWQTVVSREQPYWPLRGHKPQTKSKLMETVLETQLAWHKYTPNLASIQITYTSFASGPRFHTRTNLWSNIASKRLRIQKHRIWPISWEPVKHKTTPSPWTLHSVKYI